ncbi:hypothetical protein ABFX02_10G087300 [Erythranthe guttata]
MMSSKGDSSSKKGGENSENGNFLSDLETISESFHAGKKTPPRLASSTASSRSKSVGKFRSPEPKTNPGNTKKYPKDSLEKGKKPSLWNWKTIKANLTNVRNRRFGCRFSLLVHSIERLPDSFDGVYLVVRWKRRDPEQMTIPVKVCDGVAKFEEKLTHSCSVYVTSGPHRSTKYDPENFVVYASVYNAPELDLGKHQIDLTRLLPLTMDELEEDDEKSSGKWTTSFRLSGEAKGATMNVTFGYVVIENNATKAKLAMPSDKANSLKFRRAKSLAAIPDSEDIKELHEVLPVQKSELSDSVNILYQKLDQEMPNSSAENKSEADSLSLPVDPPTCEIAEFSVIDKGIEELTKDHVQSEVDFAFGVALVEEAVVEDAALDPPAVEVVPCEEGEVDMCSKESLMRELEVALSCTVDLVNEEFDFQEDDSDALDVDSHDRYHGKGKSIISEDVTDSVEIDFLEMLEHCPFSSSSESEPNSPRVLLYKQFEKDALANNKGLLNFDIDYDQPELADGTTTTDAFNTKTRASIMEDLENEALMHELGFDESAFQDSPTRGSDGFGGSIDMFPEDALQLPPLAEGVGPFVQTRNGGFLRSMNPALFLNSKNGGSVIMQVSNPVVVPAEMGSGVMNVLRCLASVGIEKLSMQANKLMPLEDITGKPIQQFTRDSALSLEGLERQDLLQQEPIIMQKFDSSSRSNSNTEYVSLEDLAPLAMDKIEALSIEGLRIQSGMSDDDAPSNISAQSIDELSLLKGKTVDADGSHSLCLDGTCGLQLIDVKDNGEDVDGLMGLSLTLNEWMKIDSGEIEDGDFVSERTSKILAAHHATSLDQFRGGSKVDERREKSKKYGLLGNNFTVALMVQLRDPLRDYEPVGTPMLALVQVERVFVPPKPKIYGTLSFARNSECPKENTILEKTKEEEVIYEEEEKIPQYKITEVHVAGLKTEQGRKKSWGSKNQQQSGSRWLLASGMGKKNKHPLMKSKPIDKPTGPALTTTVQPGETLWSISSRVYGAGDKWKELAELNPHIRNPNVIFPNETIKLR